MSKRNSTPTTTVSKLNSLDCYMHRRSDGHVKEKP